MKHYMVNEIFYSLQGEGMRAGTANVFVRFTGCNLRCSLEKSEKSPGGFDCDTEFESGRKLTPVELLDEAEALWPMDAQGKAIGQKWLILTGGEPALQCDEELITKAHNRLWKVAIETNGSLPVVGDVDWITVSPKVAEHAIRQDYADEVKYVRGYGQAIPKPKCDAVHRLISPAFNGIDLDQRTLQWCIELVKANPDWRLSVQEHKAWRIR